MLEMLGDLGVVDSPVQYRYTIFRTVHLFYSTVGPVTITRRFIYTNNSFPLTSGHLHITYILAFPWIGVGFH